MGFLICNLCIFVFRPQLGCVNAGLYRFYSNNYNSLAIDLSDEESKRRLFNKYVLLFALFIYLFILKNWVLGFGDDDHVSVSFWG